MKNPKKINLKQCCYVIDEAFYLGIVVNNSIHWLEGEDSKIVSLNKYDEDLSHDEDSLLNITYAFNSKSYVTACDIRDSVKLLSEVEL